MGSLVKQ